MSVSKILFTGLTLITLASPAVAGKDDYGSFDKIPEVLMNRIRQDMFIERYVAEVLEPLRRYAEDKRNLTKADIARLQANEIKEQEGRQKGKLVAFDTDQDGSVTADEIRSALKSKNQRYEEYQERLEDQVKASMKADTDGDGTISYKEMSTLDNSNLQRILASKEFSVIEDYVALGSDGQSTISAAELETLARKSFATVDEDDDGQISKAEYSSVKSVRDEMQQKKRQEKQLTQGLEGCVLGGAPIPENIIVYGAGGYRGKKLPRTRIDDSGHDATQMDVIVNVTDRPVALVLGAYEPTIWNIRRTPGTVIHSVVVGGYHNPAVLGLGKEIPVLMTSHDMKSACKDFYFKADKFDMLNPVSRQVYNKPAEKFYPVDDEGKVVIGDKSYDEATLVSDTGAGLPSVPMVGRAALDKAVEDGVLRYATQEDATAWLDAIEESEKKSPTRDIPPVEGKSLRDFLPAIKIEEGRTYVVLKDFTYPAKLTGANSSTFIVSKGVKTSGDSSRTQVFDMNDLTCKGFSISNEHELWCTRR